MQEVTLTEPFLTHDERAAAAKQFGATTDEVLHQERQTMPGSKYNRTNAVYFALHQEEIRRENAKLSPSASRRPEGISGDAESRGTRDRKSDFASNDDNAMAITMAQSFVEDRLKSPSSASFPWSFTEYIVSPGADDRWSVSGYVEAANSFNARIKTKWSVEMRRTGSKWELLSMDIQH
jgi:hypothetical protein